MRLLVEIAVGEEDENTKLTVASPSVFNLSKVYKLEAVFLIEQGLSTKLLSMYFLLGNGKQSSVVDMVMDIKGRPAKRKRPDCRTRPQVERLTTNTMHRKQTFHCGLSFFKAKQTDSVLQNLVKPGDLRKT